MKKINRNQVIFLIIYPLIHCALSYVFVMMALNSGLGPSDNNDQPISHSQELLSNIGNFMLNVLWAPINLMDHMGVRSSLPYIDWLWIFLTGILYGFLILIIYKRIKKLISKQN